MRHADDRRADRRAPLGLTERARPAPASAAGRRLDAGYEVRLTAHRGVVDAAVTSERPTGGLRLAEGRLAGEAAGLAGMLQPMCAAAHTAAALSAAEAALHIDLTPAQTAARQLLIGFEVAAACAWRMGLAWPQLTGATAHADAVQAVRAAADAAAETIYENGDWARLGGGVVRPERGRLYELVHDVRRAMRQLAPALDAITPHAPRLADMEGRTWPLLDEAGVERAAAALAEDPSFAARPLLDGLTIEESPRAILQMDEAANGLAPWFRAQARFAAQLPDRLERTLGDVDDEAPDAIALRGLVRGSGRGWGMAVTSRGRLIHWMAIERGRVHAWRAVEPTDWNFAPRGPVARAAALLDPDSDLAEASRWVVAAFDPSAPCRVTVESASAV